MFCSFCDSKLRDVCQRFMENKLNGKNMQELESMRRKKKEMRKHWFFIRKISSYLSVGNSHFSQMFSNGHNQQSHTKGYKHMLMNSCVQTRDRLVRMFFSYFARYLPVA